jgi:phenylpropionate dioxygenase-like ring-hydroxylating dioxygenase large terminal subunit
MTTSTGADLAQRYNAYNSPRDLKEDAELTRVGRGTPMGELMRRYWQPVANTREVTDLPLKVRILGEDLVLFRTGSGDYGLVEQRCAHRGASLEYGVISETGIRCAYHGFHYAPDGTILETGAGAPLANGGKICLGAYPTLVFHDLVFAYMGPPEVKPPFPKVDLYDHPHIRVESGFGRQCINEANWLQIHENAMDPVHTAYLHAMMTGTQRGFSDQMGIVPVMQWVENENGMHYIATRRVGDLVWVRALDVFMPNFGMIPPSNDVQREGICQRATQITWVVPMDDYCTKRFYLMLNDERNPLKDWQRQRGFGQANDRPYEERQRYPGDYEMMTSQGPIAIHGYENLTSTDYGVIALRQLLREGIRAVREGRDPMGIHRDANAVLRSRTQNTFVKVPPAATPDAEVALLKKVGRDVSDGDELHRFPPV